MVTSGSSHPVPWHDLPPRKFPAQQWVEQRFGFRLPPLHMRQGLRLERREFPAKAWLRRRQAHG